MKVAICVPRKQDYGRRDDIWDWVHHWLSNNHPDWPVYEGTADESEADGWSMATARNDAARQAGDWDVAVFQDGDTITHPEALRTAVIMAATSDKLVVAGDMRMTMDKTSSDEIMSPQGLWFPRPDGQHSKENCALNSCYGEPASGSVVIGRKLFDDIGGYLEPLKGWGYEDLIFMTSAFIWGGGVTWVPNSMLLHFWHERSRLTEDSHRNYQIWRDLHEISTQANKRELAYYYLKELGHTWPTR